MAFKDFPSTLQIKVIETGELVSAGGVQVAKDLDLAYMQLVVYISNGGADLASTGKLRIKMYSDQAMATAPLATSAWSVLSNISPYPSAYWIGRLLFTFNGEQMNRHTRYWFGVEAGGYSRSGGIYLGLARDYNFSQVNQAKALWMALYGYRWLG